MEWILCTIINKGVKFGHRKLTVMVQEACIPTHAQQLHQRPVNHPHSGYAYILWILSPLLQQNTIVRQKTYHMAQSQISHQILHAPVAPTKTRYTYCINKVINWWSRYSADNDIWRIKKSPENNMLRDAVQMHHIRKVVANSIRRCSTISITIVKIIDTASARAIALCKSTFGHRLAVMIRTSEWCWWW
jgi:hypothetical protein